MKNASVFTGLGFELLGFILGGLFVGREIDKYFSWPGYGVAGLIIGMIFVWIYHVIFLLKKFESQQDDTPPDGRN